MLCQRNPIPRQMLVQLRAFPGLLALQKPLLLHTIDLDYIQPHYCQEECECEMLKLLLDTTYR